MKIFSGSLATETNTFGPMPTSLNSFIEQGYYPAGTHPEEMTFFSGPMSAARLRCKEHSWFLIEGLVATAQPSGKTTRVAYETLRDELLTDLQSALPVDIVLLGLHGAMVADGFEDCEGDLLGRVRELVGPDVVIGAELDPHNHLTEEMVANSDMLIAFKEYPHTDILERGLELVDACVAIRNGLLRPFVAVADCEMIATFRTPTEPARSFVDSMKTAEELEGIISVSLTHGFPWGDVKDMGTKVIVYATSQLAADALASKLKRQLMAMRDDLTPELLGIDQAIDTAMNSFDGLTVLADAADNPGCGAAGDSTFLLRRLTERQICGAALGPLWDPGAVRIAFDAGIGATLPMRIGGKIGPLSGEPLDLTCTIRSLVRNMGMTGLAGEETNMGDCAWVTASGVDVILVSLRNQCLNVDLFDNIGLNLAEKRLVVVKSAQHFYASFKPRSRAVIYVSAPGSATLDIATLPFKNARLPKWPITARAC